MGIAVHNNYILKLNYSHFDNQTYHQPSLKVDPVKMKRSIFCIHLTHLEVVDVPCDSPIILGDISAAVCTVAVAIMVAIFRNG